MTDGWEPPCGCWDLNSGFGRAVSAEVSLQPTSAFNYWTVTKPEILISIICVGFFFFSPIYFWRNILKNESIKFIFGHLLESLAKSPLKCYSCSFRQLSFWFPNFCSFNLFFLRQSFSLQQSWLPGILADQSGLELTEICLPLPPKCWNYKCVPLQLAKFLSLQLFN